MDIRSNTAYVIICFEEHKWHIIWISIGKSAVHLFLPVQSAFHEMWAGLQSPYNGDGAEEEDNVDKVSEACPKGL